MSIVCNIVKYVDVGIYRPGQLDCSHLFVVVQTDNTVYNIILVNSVTFTTI